MDVGRWRKLCQKASPNATALLGRAGRRPGRVVSEPYPMPVSPADLFAALDRLGIAAPDRDPPAAVHGRAVAERCAARFPAGTPRTCSCATRRARSTWSPPLEDAAIELKSLHRRLGASGRFSFGSADLLMETLGVVPGAVTPLAAINDTEGRVTVVLDAGLMEHAVINCHPLTNTMTTSLARADLVRFLEATGHPPRIVPVAGPETPAP